MDSWECPAGMMLFNVTSAVFVLIHSELLQDRFGGFLCDCVSDVVNKIKEREAENVEADATG